MINFPITIQKQNNSILATQYERALMMLYSISNFYNDNCNGYLYNRPMFNLNLCPLPFNLPKEFNFGFSQLPFNSPKGFNFGFSQLPFNSPKEFNFGFSQLPFNSPKGFNFGYTPLQFNQTKEFKSNSSDMWGDMGLNITPESTTTSNVTKNTSKIFVNKDANPHVVTRDEYDDAMKGKLTYPVIKIGNVTYYKVNSSNGLNKEAVAAFNKMKAEAAKDGINLKIVSGYRTHSDQINLFQKYYNSKGKKNIEETAKFSAIPGYSEHESGKAFDINTASRKDNFENTSAYKWLKNNAHKYGFELSYPENNKEGLIFEPWHWRYVG